MAKYYIAVTYDICEHINLYHDMNSYTLNSSIDFEEQARAFAQKDVASLVKVYEAETNDAEVLEKYWELPLYKEYIFEEFECSCGK